MSLGNDFIGGFQATRAIREKRLDRDLELERDLKRQKFEQSMQGERITADALKQFNAQTFQAGEGEKDRGFRTGEGEKDRTHRTGERLGSQAHQTTESAAERNLRKVLQKDTQKQNAQQFTDRLNFDYQNMGLGAGLKAREQNWRENPENPENKWRDARADQVEDLRAPFAPPAPGTPKAPGAGDQLPTLTPQQAQAAKPGTRYRTVDGRILTR